VSDNKVFLRTYDPKRDEVTEVIQFHTEELYNLYTSLIITMTNKQRRIR
jgi:hypothetical protein